MTYKLLEPNPAPGREMRPSFFNERTRYFEDLLAIACTKPGLLGRADSGCRSFVYIEPSDLLKMRSLTAIGENGHIISINEIGGIETAKPLDCRALPIGVHQIYACLTSSKVTCGNPIEIIEEPGSHSKVTTQRYLKSRIVLEVGDKRFEHRDWFQVAEVNRLSQGGIVRTILNERFHPSIHSMEAYCHSNPLCKLTDLILTRLAMRHSEDDSTALRIELTLLKNIASSGSPEQVFLQAQKCLLLLSCRPELVNLAVGQLIDVAYDHNSFCEFLAMIDDCINSYGHEDELPDSLEADGKKYFRLPGELTQEGDLWSWNAPEANFNANSILVYLPRVAPGSVPNVHYGSDKSEQVRSVGSFATRVSGAGTAIKLDRLSGRIKSIVVAVDRLEYQQRLVMQLGEGHALYYC